MGCTFVGRHWCINLTLNRSWKRKRKILGNLFLDLILLLTENDSEVHHWGLRTQPSVCGPLDLLTPSTPTYHPCPYDSESFRSPSFGHRLERSCLIFPPPSPLDPRVTSMDWGVKGGSRSLVPDGLPGLSRVGRPWELSRSRPYTTGEICVLLVLSVDRRWRISILVLFLSFSSYRGRREGFQVHHRSNNERIKLGNRRNHFCFV